MVSLTGAIWPLEQAQIDRCGVFRKEREVDAGAVPGSSQRIWLSWPHLHDVLPLLCCANLFSSIENTSSASGRSALRGGFHPAPEHFRHTPGLRDTPTRRERLLSIEDLADRAESCLIQLWDKTLSKLRAPARSSGYTRSQASIKGPMSQGHTVP